MFTSKLLHQAAAWRPESCYSSLRATTQQNTSDDEIVDTTDSLRGSNEGVRNKDVKRRKRILWLQKWRPRSLFVTFRRAFNALTRYALQHKSNALVNNGDNDVKGLTGATFVSMGSRNKRGSSAASPYEDDLESMVHELQEGEASHVKKTAPMQPLCPAGTHQVEPSWSAWAQGLNHRRHSSEDNDGDAVALYACAPCPLNHVCPYNDNDFGTPLMCPPDSHPSMNAESCDLNCREGYMWTGNSCTVVNNAAAFSVPQLSLFQNRGQRGSRNPKKRKQRQKWISNVLDVVHHPWRGVVASSSSSSEAPHGANVPPPQVTLFGTEGDHDYLSEEALGASTILHDPESESLYCHLFGDTWELAAHILATLTQFGKRGRNSS